jgi:hypothetical protein
MLCASTTSGSPARSSSWRRTSCLRYGPPAEQAPAARDPNAPAAVLLVNGFSGLGLATLMMIPRLFGGQFRNVIFVSVGEIDSALLKGHEEVRQLEQQVADDLLEYCRLAEDLGFHTELRTGLGPELVTELRRL